MRALLVSIIMAAIIMGGAYGFAATLTVTSVDDIGNQTVGVSWDDEANPFSCTMSGFTCTVQR